MYWFPPDKASSFSSGFDIRCGRLRVLGFDIYPFQKTFHLSESESSYNLLELLSGPLLIARESKMFEPQFLNIMHALQVPSFNLVLEVISMAFSVLNHQKSCKIVLIWSQLYETANCLVILQKSY